MKKILSGIICIVVALCLCGCGENTSGSLPAEEMDKPMFTVPTTEPTAVEETTLATQQATEPVPEDPYAPIIDALLMGYTETEGIPGYPEMSYMYMHYDVSQIGYALEDLDGDGQAELLLSSMDAPFVFDAFTVQDGMPVHVFTSAERYSHQVCSDGYVQLFWSSSAATSGTDHFQFINGNLVLLERIAYDAWYAQESGLIDDLIQATEDNCYFISSTGNTEDYQPVSAEEAAEKAQEYMDMHPKMEIEYTPISHYE